MRSVYFFRFLSSLIFLLLLTGAARAASFTVNNTTDTSDAVAGNGICADGSGNCTLRAAIQETNALAGDDTINFDPGLTGATITLTTGVEIVISTATGAIQIHGLGANNLAIDGGAGSNRIFNTSGVGAVTFTGLTLQGGGSVPRIGPQGGAINASGNTLVLNAVHILNNNSGDGGGIFIQNGTNHRILNSTISGNAAANNGGLYYQAGTLSVANTTISGNTVSGQTAGAAFSGGTVTFRNSTITNNTATSAAGGIQVGSTAFNMGNTIIAGNNAPNFPEILHFNTITSAGNNFIGDSMGDSTSTNVPIAYQASDIRDQNPLHGGLVNNGGRTPTHALLMGSLAINAGDNAKAVDPFNGSALTSDQRGYFRIAAGTVDIGAYEFNAAPTSATVSVSGRVLVGKGYGVGKSSVSLTDLSGNTHATITNPFGYYRFEDVEVGQTYIISVTSKRYQFATQVVFVTDELTELNFTAEP